MTLRPTENLQLSNFKSFSYAGKALVKVFQRGKWIKRNITINDVFLLIFSKKKILEEAIFLEGCIFKVRKNVLSIIYSTQCDERISFCFETSQDCIQYAQLLNEAANIKKFKDCYVKKEKIGQGKFSEVYIANEIATGNSYAMKCIQKRIMDYSERESIRKELVIHSELLHKGIAKFKEFFDSRKSIIIVMEYIKGIDLLKTINTMKNSEIFIKDVIKQILEAVEYLHKLGIIHRDLKPENILTIEDNERTCIKIIDFGLSTFSRGFYEINSCFGSLGYTAPEVFTGKCTYKADVWSIGVITYAFFLGKLPFFSYIKEEMITMTRNKELDFSDEKWNSYSEESKDFIKALLEKDPNLRLDCSQALDHSWFKDNLS